MPKVSVIISCYNHGRFLDEAVDSVLAQTFQDFEVIIVNDGSTDEFTNKLLATYHKPKARVLNQTNHGLPGARNNGIKVSSGEYIVCLDADDYLHPEFLAKTIPILDADHGHQYGFVMTWVQLFGDMNFVWETSEYDPYIVGMRNGMHPAAPFRKECWDKVGGFREHMTFGFEDWDFWIAIAALGYKWGTVKEPLIYYRKRAGSMLTESNKKRQEIFRQIIRNNEEYYRKNFEEIIVRGVDFFYSKLKIYEGESTERNKVKNKLIKMIIKFEKIRSSLRWKLTGLFRAVLDLFNLWKLDLSVPGYDSLRVENSKYPSQMSNEERDSYLCPSFTSENMDRYLIRTSILNEIKVFLSQHHGVLLDVGCGKMPYKPLVLEYGARYRYIGLDIENPRYQHDVKPDFFWDGIKIPLDNCSVDCAMATELFEHLPQPEQVMKEIWRVLKPDGHLFFTVPFLWPLHDLPYDEYRYTPFALERHLRNCGFDAISISSLGGWDASLAQMIGLWVRRKPMPEAERAKVSSELFPYYQKLIERDEKPEGFSEGQMITGLYGVAVKQCTDFGKREQGC